MIVRGKMEVTAKGMEWEFVVPSGKSMELGFRHVVIPDVFHLQLSL